MAPDCHVIHTVTDGFLDVSEPTLEYSNFVTQTFTGSLLRQSVAGSPKSKSCCISTGKSSHAHNYVTFQ